MPKKDFLFVDLSLAGDNKVIDGMAAGTFTDMWGRETVFVPEELPAYVANTKRALESTKDSNGQIVGFPIDAYGHVADEAAGWITDVNMAEGRSIIQFTVRWNSIGVNSIGGDTMRYFSPSIDVNQKVIVGGSLTNWPATRTEDHQILLHPVELSAQLQSLPDMGLWERVEMIVDKVTSRLAVRLPGATNPEPQAPEITPIVEADMPKFEDLTDEQKATLRSQALAELTSGTPPVELQTLIDKRAGEIAAVELAQAERKAHIAELTAKWTGGTDAKPYGLPIPATELAELLTSLTPEAQGKVEGVLSRIFEAGLIDFQEHGSSRVQEGTAILPAEIAVSLNHWIDAGQTIEAFFKANAADLGAMADYNLTEFRQKEKK